MAVGACYPRGFSAGIASCGMKRSGKADLALIASDRPAIGRRRLHHQPRGRRAGDRQPRPDPGRQRPRDRHQRGLGQRLHRRRRPPRRLDDGATPQPERWRSIPREVLVASTGVIGVPLPIDDVVAGIQRRRRDGWPAPTAARPRTRSAPPTPSPSSPTRQIEIGGTTVRIGGVAKGAGMIRPDMATTLAHVTIDAEVPHATLRRRAPAGRCRVVQRHLGGRLHQHQRLRLHAGKRRLRADRRERRGRRGCWPGRWAS